MSAQKKIPYPGDVFEKDGITHIVISVSFGKAGLKTESMPLREYIEKYKIIKVDGRYTTISNILDAEMEEIIQHARKL